MNEEIKEHIKGIECEVLQILSYLEKVGSISIKRKNLLKEKLDILLQSIYFDLQKIEENESKKEKQYENLFKMTMVTEGLKSMGMKTISLTSYLDSKLEEEDSISYDFNRLLQRVNDLRYSFIFSYRLLELKEDKSMVMSEIDSYSIEKIISANELLTISLCVGSLYEDVEPDIKNIMVLLLQDLLQTAEDDLQKLFQLALEKEQKLEGNGQNLV